VTESTAAGSGARVTVLRMQLQPRYQGEPVIRMHGVVTDPATPLLRQRARLAGLLAELDDEQWATASRCDGWTVQDVIAHLTTTNQFWAFSIDAGLQGAPSTFLAEFDPVASPAQLVDAVRSWTPAETLARFTEASEALAATVAGIDGEQWSALAETPPGHLAVELLALHALWDAWIHERDIRVPLGLDPVDEPDEILGSLVYVAALGPAFLALDGSERRGTLEVRTTHPDLRFLVDVGPNVLVHDGAAPSGAVTLAGDAVELLEALSFRAPLTAHLHPDDRWLLGSLGAVFEQDDAPT
jgi:uncharacterized protein (TIGR03083 family)